MFKGKTYIVKNAWTDLVVVDTTDAGKIDYEDSVTLIPGECIQVVSDGANWHII